MHWRAMSSSVKLVPAALLVCAMLSGTARAETNVERGKRVVDEAIAALGGDKFLTMRDRVETGRAYSFFREQLSGLSRATIYTRYLTRPEPPVPGFLGQRERQAFGKDEDSAVIFTEGKGYEITFRGARPMPQETVDRYGESARHNIFYILRQRLGEPGLVFVSRGAEVWANQPVELVEISDADNRTVTVAFHRSTKLPVRQSYVRRDPKTRERIEEVTVFSKYRDAGGGVMWPFTMERSRDGEKIFEIYSDRVAVNQDLRDDLFLLPSDMKILKPAR
jgi:hypothetical protein